MHVGNAVGKEVDDLVGRVSDACLLHSRGSSAEFINQGLKALRHKGAGQLDGSLDLIAVCDGHNAGDDGHCNSRFADFIKEVIEQIVIKKHLRGEKIASCIDLFFEVFDVFFLVSWFNVAPFELLSA